MPVQTPHPQYTTALPLWQRCRTVYDGEDAVKAAGTTFLPRPGGMTEADYAAYVARAAFFNALKPTVDGFLGLVFRQPPEATLPEGLAAHLDDITLDDTPFRDLAFRTFRELLVVSRAGLLLDFSAVHQRPYWVPYTAEQVLSWRVGRVRDTMTLTRVVLEETVEEPDPTDPWVPRRVTQLRVLLLEETTPGQWAYRVELYRRAEREGKVTGDYVLSDYVLIDQSQPTRRGVPLNFLPFVLLGPIGLDTAVALPVLLDLVNVNLAQYRNAADYEHGLHYTGAPTPVVTGAPQSEEPLRIGSSTAWLLPQGADAKFLEFRGEGLGALKTAIEDKKAAMAALGARLLDADTSGGAETAEAVRLRYSGEHARLRTLAESAGLAFSALLRWHAWWATAVDAIDPQSAAVTFTTEFVETRLSPEERKVLLLEWQAGAISHETYYAALERGKVTRPGVSFADEQQAIAAGDPLAPPEAA